MYLLINPVGALITLSLCDHRGKVVACEQWAADRTLHATLWEHFDVLFARAKVEPKDLQGIYCITGPGSYTTLRIVLTAVNTMGYVLQVPLYGISLFELLTFVVANRLKDFDEDDRLISVSFHCRYGDQVFWYRFLSGHISQVVVVELRGNNDATLVQVYCDDEFIVRVTVSDKMHFDVPSGDYFPFLCEFVVQQLAQNSAVVLKVEKKEVIVPVYAGAPVITVRKDK
ncbi:MAG: tRNA (adenosine(37)-N6)-threonylcarbamoyltransferase complex dimerization subunit type 1 TsaB [bacterium]